MLDLKLKDTHVLVTGGTKGIGRTILEKFLSEGANVSYCSRSATGNEYTSFLQSTHPTGSQPPASGSAVEIGDPAQVQEWVDSAAKKFGRIDTVVANAATVLYDTNSPCAWATSVQTDILGFVALCSAATPYLTTSPSPSPSIILISTIVAHYASIGMSAPYGPVKAAQHRHAMALARQLGPGGVRVNVVSPGPVESPAMDEVRAKEGGEEILRGMLGMIPMGRLGKKEDVANAVVWLGSGCTKWISGAELVVDGGFTTFA
ncbi:MAG: hypothetical protein MMC23_002070 [Stictis urceolatum]|nr:hypothetical protein [Stictis urceolata]